ncbi:MAG: hypothetical protein SF053_07250 [Bacteroidia bacterium]|nr:hypothetical protein [Bacteroidia bacterium]
MQNRREFIEKLSALGDLLRTAGVPDEIKSAAVNANPWFTPYFIDRAVAAISTWLTPTQLDRFLDHYPPRTASPADIGIICPGNFPLAGWYDVLMGLMSGNRVQARYSHQDQVLMRWMMENWFRIDTKTAKFFREVTALDHPDFLLATGSNNTARYLHARYPDTPRLIRHNRFSAAILDPGQPPDITRLQDDIFLYNGLGCRNVSNIILLPGGDKEFFMKKLTEIPPYPLNPLYLERVLIESVKSTMIREDEYCTDVLIITPSDTLRYASMGYLYLIEVQDKAEADFLLASCQDHLQCVVGREIQPGQTQYPSLGDFPDNQDIFQIMLHI